MACSSRPPRFGEVFFFTVASSLVPQAYAPRPPTLLKTDTRRPWTRLSTSPWHARGGGAQGAAEEPVEYF